MSLIAIGRRIAILEQQMRQAAEAEDFETAARLRNEIAQLRGREAPQMARKPPPGQMGLGTHIPVAEPPKGWKKPPRPDPMTRTTSRGRPPAKR